MLKLLFISIFVLASSPGLSANLLRLTVGPAIENPGIWEVSTTAASHRGKIDPKPLDTVFNEVLLSSLPNTRAIIEDALRDQEINTVYVLVNGWGFNISDDTPYDTIFSDRTTVVSKDFFGLIASDRAPCTRPVNQCSLSTIRRASWLKALELQERQNALIVTIAWDSSGSYEFAMAKTPIASHVLFKILAILGEILKNSPKLHIISHSLGTSVTSTALLKAANSNSTALRPVDTAILLNGAASNFLFDHAVDKVKQANHDVDIVNIIGSFDTALAGATLKNSGAYYDLFCENDPSRDRFWSRMISYVRSDSLTTIGVTLPGSISCDNWPNFWEMIGLLSASSSGDRRYLLYPIGQLLPDVGNRDRECVKTKRSGTVSDAPWTEVRPSWCTEDRAPHIRVVLPEKGQGSHYNMTGIARNSRLILHFMDDSVEP